MATWSDDEVAAYAAEHPEIGDARRRIEEGREGGVWWTAGGYVEGLTSAATGIVGRGGRALAAVYAYGPSYRFPDDDRVREIESTLVDGAARIARLWAAGTTAPLPASLALEERRA
jgi:DNA-binding IclR family transcriptional regulator